MKQNFLQRKRIDRLLDRFTDYPLTIVEAPMGYGKTTAVRLFLENHQIEPVWLSFFDQAGSGDWARLAREVGRLDPAAGTALAELGFPADIPQMEQVLTLLGQFAGEEQRVIVLDDYHLAGSTRLHALLERLVLEQVDNLYVILITRNTIGFKAVMLTAKGLAQQITKAELTFSKAEVTAYCQLMIDSIDVNTLQHIIAYGEGWISLTYMLLRGLEQGFPVGLQLSLEALIEQTLFSSYEPDTQNFLMELAMMTHFTGAQAAYVTSYPDAEARLLVLQPQNSFISMDERQDVYTIHAVLRDFLLKRQQLTDSEKKAYLQRLGQWHLAHHNFQTAYYYFYQAREIKKILAHLDDPVHIRNEMGEFEGFKQLLEETPTALLFAYPIAYLQLILLSLLRGSEAEGVCSMRRLDALEAHYLALEGIEKKRRERVLAEILIIRKFTVFNQIEASTAMNDRILKLLGGEQSYIMKRDNEFTFGSPHLLYLYYREPGTFLRTAALIEKKFPVYSQYADGCGSGAEYLAMAEYALEAGDWDKAQQNAQQAIYKAELKEQYSVIICARFVILRLLVRNGQMAEAVNHFHQLETQLLALHHPLYNTTIELCKGYLYALLGQPERIPFWLQQGQMQTAEFFYQGVAFNYLVFGKALVAAGDFLRLDVLTEEFEACFLIYHNQLGLIHNAIFKALAEFALRGWAAGLVSLAGALALARTDAIILPFVENAKALVPLLDEMARANPNDTFVGRILAECADFDEKTKNQQLPAFFLSQREKEVLTLLTKGYKREAIGQQLFISVATVRKHLQNIYKKLDVKGKHAAIQTAIRNRLVDVDEDFE